MTVCVKKISGYLMLINRIIVIESFGGEVVNAKDIGNQFSLEMINMKSFDFLFIVAD
jgi:hypothetical protein